MFKSFLRLRKLTGGQYRFGQAFRNIFAPRRQERKGRNLFFSWRPLRLCASHSDLVAAFAALGSLRLAIIDLRSSILFGALGSLLELKRNSE
jgi:hypothetical protein